MCPLISKINKTTMTIQEIKKEFFALRNGLLGDTLRKAGMPYSVIFGLNVPQLGEIARRALSDCAPETRKALARELWADTKVRESRLLACWIFNPETVGIDEAKEMMASVQTREEADILAFRLLRHLPFAHKLAAETPDTYAREALLRNLASQNS